MLHLVVLLYLRLFRLFHISTAKRKIQTSSDQFVHKLHVQ
ncbi:hypothetical protein GLYMA_02G197650v4 [Glycine max]|nr:hypothetical protein GLYMA_02G197650v4 [Glycine max]KAH1061182.1 hypothetical protein GYH30_004599 [Glycine max]